MKEKLMDYVNKNDRSFQYRKVFHAVFTLEEGRMRQK